MIVSEITLYEMLKAKLGDKEAAAFLNILETRVDKKFEEAKDTLATKEDIAKLDSKISESKAEIIKWMFVFIMGLLISISGVMIALLHAYLK